MKKRLVPLVEQHGIITCGGAGTYVFLGPSDSGKNVCFKHALKQAFARGLVFDSVISYSSTQEFNDSLDVIEEVSDTERWARCKSKDEILLVFEHRKQHFKSMSIMLDPELGRPKTKEEIKEWAMDHPIAIVLDDFGGEINMSRNTDNPWYSLVTMARHIGVYFFMMIQFKTAIGPAFWTNLRCIVSFDRSEEILKKIATCGGFNKYKDYTKQVSKWLATPYAFTLWWCSWRLQSERPQLPWLVYPVVENQPLRVESCKNVVISNVSNSRNGRKQFIE